MIVNFRKTRADAVTPTKAYDADAGFDLTAVSVEYNTEHGYLSYGTGLAVDIPKGHVGLLFPRSSICKYDLSLANCVGVVDAGYHGEVCFRFKELERPPSAAGALSHTYTIGDRIGQLVIIPIPTITLHEVGEFRPSDRGTSGWGSSGR